MTWDKLTSFEKFCVSIDARLEFGNYERTEDGTPISIIHAAEFTFVGQHLVRMKDYCIVVLSRHMPVRLVVSCGITITVFRIKDGRIIAGRHMLLGAAYLLF